MMQQFFTANSALMIKPAFFIAVIVLSGCQAPFQSPNALASVSQAALLRADAAKAAMLDAKLKHRTTSYVYQTSIKLDNTKYREALSNASDLQLSMAQADEQHCNHAHDQAYAALLQRVETEGNDIQNEQYDVQREAIKSAFLACDAELKAWRASRPDTLSYEDYDFMYEEDIEDVYPEEPFDATDYLYGYEEQEADEAVVVEAEVAKEATIIDELDMVSDNVPARLDRDAFVTEDAYQTYLEAYEDYKPSENSGLQSLNSEGELSEGGLDDNVPTREAFLPNYDNKHTSKQVKKARLLDAYLIKPLDAYVQGIYRPRRGILTASPTIQYQSRLHTTAINQPVYLDAQAGTLSLWADNFAYPMSEYLDPKLGLSWQDKWLTFKLDDGTLPKGFGKHLIQSVFHATDIADQSIDSRSFSSVSAQSLLAATPSLSELQQEIINNTPQILSMTLDAEQLNDYGEVYVSTLYDELVSKYPELMPEAGLDPDSMSDEEVVATLDIEINETQEDGADEDTSEEASESIFSSINIVKQSLGFLKSLIEEGAESGSTDDISLDDGTSDKTTINNSIVDNNALPVPSSIEYAKLDDFDEKDMMNHNDLSGEDLETASMSRSEFMPQKDGAIRSGSQLVYGLNNKGEILWSLNHDPDVNDGVTYRMFTSYSPITGDALVFPNLPVHTQKPDSKHQIDLREYLTDLKERTENGEGTREGELLFESLDFMIQMMLMGIQN